MDIDYGSLGRVGLIVPSANVSAETEIRAMLPKEVALNVTRLKLTGSSAADIKAMRDGAATGAKLLADARVDLIAFHCTAASAWSPTADEELMRSLTDSSGLSSTTTATAVLAALDALNARSVVLISPYIDQINMREVNFLRAHGADLVSYHGLDISDPHLMNEVEPSTWLMLAKQHARSAGALFISCAAIRTAGVIDEIERELDIPVVTSNQAMAWHCLRSIQCDKRESQYGRLMKVGAPPSA